MICTATLLLSGPTAFAQGATGGSLGNDTKTLSGSAPEPRSAPPARRERTERRAPRSRSEGGGGGGGGNFDGVWSISSAGTSGCSDTLTEQFVVSGGRMTGNNAGSATVSNNGAIRGSGNYSGIRVTSQGRLSGRTGSGTFQRSDGCSGRWVASKQ